MFHPLYGLCRDSADGVRWRNEELRRLASELYVGVPKPLLSINGYVSSSSLYFSRFMLSRTETALPRDIGSDSPDHGPIVGVHKTNGNLFLAHKNTRHNSFAVNRSKHKQSTNIRSENLPSNDICSCLKNSIDAYKVNRTTILPSTE
jgi:hypothetical protein